VKHLQASHTCHTLYFKEVIMTTTLFYKKIIHLANSNIINQFYTFWKETM